jgi:hypothetical protein
MFADIKKIITITALVVLLALTVPALAVTNLPVVNVPFGAEGGNLQNGGTWNYTDRLYGMAMADNVLGLYTTDAAGTKTLLAEGYVSQVNVLGGYVYYLSLPNPAKVSGYICRVPLDGSGATERLSKDKAVFLLAAGDTLYYTLDGSGNLCAIATDGTGKKVLVKSSCGLLCGEGGTVYFENKSKKTLCALSAASGDITAAKLDYTGYGQVMDGVFYYRDAKNQLCSCALDGTGKLMLYKGPVDALNAGAGTLYFTDMSNGSFPCSMLQDGTNLTVLAKTPVDYIVRVNGSLYLINRGKGSILVLGADGSLAPGL